jgi:methionine biosynthesis protein MetW
MSQLSEPSFACNQEARSFQVESNNDNSVRRFYDQMYAEGRTGRAPGGLIGQAFMRLRRFELHRIPATFELLEPGGRMLDIGCGDGSLLALARGSKFQEVCGIDVAPAVVQRAEETCAQRLGSLDGVHVKCADLNETLPFEDNSFDAVTAIAVIEHLFDPYFSVDEVHRLLRPGGQFIMEVPNLAWLPRRVDVLLGRLPVTGDEDGWDGGHLHYFTFQTVRDLLSTHGFNIQYIGATGVFPRVRNIWPALLGGNVFLSARKIVDKN